MKRSADFAARLAALQQRSAATDKAAAATLQQLQHQGREVAEALEQLAAEMERT
jgi:hypothetical protein